MNIALVAHDSRKQELIEWVRFNAATLAKHKLYATGTTGRLIRAAFEELASEGDNSDRSKTECRALYGAASQNVNCLLSGPLGGDQQIGAMIAEGAIDVLIFFCDNLIVQGHQNDVSALTRLASLYNIAFATNRTTADMILTSPLMDDTDYRRVIPGCISNYAKRKL